MEAIKKHKIWIIIALIMALGFFLRAYNFSEWLRFNADQSRDFNLASQALKESSLPAFGPKAGGTEFKLGPIFYYFQIASLGLFGSFPAAAAYPDLIFGTASIFLFFLLCRVFLENKTAMALAFLFAISHFAVNYSRFAWNPNSTSFFIMLTIFSFYKLSAAGENKKIFWAIAAGMAIGIGIQLHTSLLIILPLFGLIALGYLFKTIHIKKALIVAMLVSAIFVNSGQIADEIKTGGKNILQFLIGSTEKSGRNSSWGKNILRDFSCHAKASHHIVFALGDREECGYGDVFEKFKKLDSHKVPFFEKAKFIAFLTLSLAFFIGGYFLLFRAVKKEDNASKKLLLKLLAAYAALFFLFSIVWATELSIRFFLPLAFIPFILLGIWIEFLQKLLKSKWLPFLFLIILASFLNVWKNYGIYRDLKYGGREIEGDFEYMTLGEGNFVIDFIEKNSNGQKVYIDAQKGYLFKIIKPLNLLAEKKFEIVQIRKGAEPKFGDKFFYIRNSNSHCELPESLTQEYKKINCSSYRQFSVFLVEWIK